MYKPHVDILSFGEIGGVGEIPLRALESGVHLLRVKRRLGELEALYFDAAELGHAEIPVAEGERPRLPALAIPFCRFAETNPPRSVGLRRAFRDSIHPGKHRQ